MREPSFDEENLRRPPPPFRIPKQCDFALEKGVFPEERKQHLGRVLGIILHSIPVMQDLPRIALVAIGVEHLFSDSDSLAGRQDKAPTLGTEPVMQRNHMCDSEYIHDCILQSYTVSTLAHIDMTYS